MRIPRVATLALAGLIGLATSVVVAGAPASAGQPSGLTGTIDCDPQTGEQIITWVFQNFTQQDADITGTVLDTSGLTAGGVSSATVTMAPDPTPSLGASTGFSLASADAVGTVSLTIDWFNAVDQQPAQNVGAVTLLGECVIPETTAVETTAVETTAVDTTAAATTVTTTGVGSGGQGRIPQTGSDDTLMWLGTGFVTAGAVLLLIRRRVAASS